MFKQIALLLLIISCTIGLQSFAISNFALSDGASFALGALINSSAHASSDNWIEPTLVGTVLTGSVLWAIKYCLAQEGLAYVNPRDKLLFALLGTIAGTLAGKTTRYVAKGLKYSVWYTIEALRSALWEPSNIFSPDPH